MGWGSGQSGGRGDSEFGNSPQEGMKTRHAEGQEIYLTFPDKTYWRILVALYEQYIWQGNKLSVKSRMRQGSFDFSG